MSFKKNIAANYTSQIYSSLVAILIVPLYLKYMGAEVYGLIAIFAMMQGWFSILDMGITPSIARETTRFHGGAISAQKYRELFRALQSIFIFVMLIAIVILFCSINYIASSWLKLESLSIIQVKTAIELMILGVALRWLSSLYRAVITGAENFVWLGYFNLIFTTLRYIGVLLFLIYVGPTATVFFTYQMVISGLELFFFANKVIRDLPQYRKDQHPKPSLYNVYASIKPIMSFAVSIGATSLIWILITQTDKLILSKMLSLSEYGYYSIAVIAAGGVMTLCGPISNALTPRLTNLKALGDEVNFLKLYRQTTQFVAALVIPSSLVLSIFSKEVLWLWTGNLDISIKAAPVLSLYVLGNGMLVLTSFTFYIQYAFGKMKLHLIGNIIFTIFLVPSIVWSTCYYGMIGAGWSWLLSNVLFFLFWTKIVHDRFFKKLHYSWLLQDILPLFALSLMIITLLIYFTRISENKAMLFVQIILILFSMISLNFGCIKYNKRYKFNSNVAEIR